MDAKHEFSIKTIPPTSYIFSRKLILGKGTFGEVYLGFDEAHGTPVAVKMIPLDKLHHANSNPEAIFHKLSTEMINMQIAKSEYLVKLIGPQKSSKNLYLVCQYCNGKSLKDYLDKKGILTESEALYFFKQILRGFKCLHEKKIVHRDLKPANLLLHNYKIKIGDFGFSKAIDMHEQILTSIVGSPLYMSPQILNQDVYTQKTDIWSLGIILYEMLFGQAPWRVSSIQDIKEKVKQKPEFPKNSHISEPTRKLIQSMLEYDEKNRVGWQQLFSNYLNPAASQMVDEASEGLETSITRALDYFGETLSIDNEQHIIHILQSNGKPYVEPTDNCNSAIEFFSRVRDLEKIEAALEPIFTHFMSARNRVNYLMKLFVELYDYVEEGKKVNCTHITLISSLFLILKYCACAISELLEANLANKPNQELFLNSSLSRNIHSLLLLDLQVLNSIYPLFIQQYYLPKMQKYANSEEGREAQKNIGAFLSNESTSSKYVGFWAKNYLRMLFNQIRKGDKISESEYIISRLIYEYDKSDKSHLFEICGVKAGTNKKIESWRYDRKWGGKLLEIHPLESESLAAFMNKEVKWNPLGQYQFSFLSQQ